MTYIDAYTIYMKKLTRAHQLVILFASIVFVAGLSAFIGFRVAQQSVHEETIEQIPTPNVAEGSTRQEQAPQFVFIRIIS